MPEDAVRESHIIDIDLPFDFSLPLQAEEQIKEALRPNPEAPLPAARVLEIRTQAARLQCMQGRIAEAEQTLIEVHKALAQVTEPAPRLRYMLETGRLFTLKRTPSQAQPLFREAFELAKSLGEDFFAID